jgi:hypothetical protein
MVLLFDAVLDELKKMNADAETIQLWKSIEKWTKEGGPSFVERKILKIVDDIKNSRGE